MVNLRAPIFYLGMDFYQGLPGFWFFPNYYLITYRAHPVIKKLPFANRIFTLGDKTTKVIPRSSGHLLNHPLVQKFIIRHTRGDKVFLTFFKPSRKIEIIAQKKGWRLIGNRQALAKRLENKIQLWQLLHRYPEVHFPPVQVEKLGGLNYRVLAQQYKGCFVLQLGLGWAGRSTFKVCSAKEFVRLQQKYPKQWVKITPFFLGWTLTNNNVVTPTGEVYSSYLAWQITGQKMLCPGLPMATCGRVWAVSPGKQLENNAKKISQFIGFWLHKQGFRGFFGLDFLLTSNGQLYFQELNPRLTASAAFSALSELKQKLRPLLFYHYASFLPLKVKNQWQRSKLQGGEIVSRAPSQRIIKKSVASGAYNFQKQYLGAHFFPSQEWITFIGGHRGEKIYSGSEVFRLSGWGKLGEWQGQNFRLASPYRNFYYWIKQYYGKA